MRRVSHTGAPQTLAVLFGLLIQALVAYSATVDPKLDVRSGRYPQSVDGTCEPVTTVTAHCFGQAKENSVLVFDIRPSSPSEDLVVMVFSDQDESYPAAQQKAVMSNCTTLRDTSKVVLSDQTNYRVPNTNHLRGNISISDPAFQHVWYVVIASCDGDQPRGCPAAEFNFQFKDAAPCYDTISDAVQTEFSEITKALSLSSMLNIFGLDKVAVGFTYSSFGLFLISAVLFFCWSLNVSSPKRMPHYLVFVISSISMMSYLVIATGHGNFVLRNFKHQGWQWQKDLLLSPGNGPFRNPFYSRDYAQAPMYILFYARYVDMALTGPLLLACLSLLAAPPMHSMFFIMGCNVLMVVSLFIGAIMLSAAKWAMWIFALFFYVNIVYMLLRGFKGSTMMRGSSVSSTYSCLCFVLLFAWTPQLLLWILSDGSHSLPNNLVIFINGALDLVSKVVFGVIFLRSKFVKQGAAFQFNIGIPGALEEDNL